MSIEIIKIYFIMKTYSRNKNIKFYNLFLTKQDEGGIAISSKMIVYLLNRLKEFNEWG